jgi:hypothetical protein
MKGSKKEIMTKQQINGVFRMAVVELKAHLVSQVSAFAVGRVMKLQTLAWILNCRPNLGNLSTSIHHCTLSHALSIRCRLAEIEASPL